MGQGMPSKVERFSDPNEIVIEGVEQVPKDQIYDALKRSSRYVLAAHPSAEFEDYLSGLKSCLSSGYLAMGYPKADIAVGWNSQRKTVVATVKEGPRFNYGKILLEGVKGLDESVVRDALVDHGDEEEAFSSRSELVFEYLSMSKALSPELWVAHAKEMFADLKEQEAAGKLADMMDVVSGSSDEEKPPGVWKSGEWANLHPFQLKLAEIAVRHTYASEGYFFPEMEIQTVKSDKEQSYDLLVRITDEGPPSHLGDVRVTGNFINADHDILALLDLKPGMKLKGGFVQAAERKLFDSGRFSGWKLVPKRAGPQSVKIDLLIHVEEQWEAPSLKEPFSNEQEAMLRLVKWMNSEAGKKADIVIAFADPKSKAKGRLAMSERGIGISIDGHGHHIRAVGEWGGELEVVIRIDGGAVFRGSMPLTEVKLMAILEIYASRPINPLDKSMSLGIASGFGSRTKEPLLIAMDPALGVQLCGSHNGNIVTQHDGQVQVANQNMRLVVNESTGELVSLTVGLGEIGAIADPSSAGFVMKPDPNGIASIRQEMREVGKGVPNWSEGKSETSLVFMLAAYLVELANSENIDDASFEELSMQAGKRTKKWTPVAQMLGGVISAMRVEGDETEDVFSIPLYPNDRLESLEAGQGINFILGSEFYEALMARLEPGSWPEILAREILFMTDGKTMYLPQTLEKLYKDEQMGPMGSLMCASLLKMIKHPAQSAFVGKAKAQSHADGFAKDWKILLTGNVDEESVGWAFLKSLKNFDDGSIDELVPEKESRLRRLLKEMVNETQKITAKTKSAAFKPVLDSLWEHYIADFTKEMIVMMETGTKSKPDPKEVALMVNKYPVHHSSIPLVSLLESDPANTLFPNLMGVWNLDDHVNEGEANRQKCVTTLLLAQDLMDSGRPSANAQAVGAYGEKLGRLIGDDGLRKIQKMGFDKEKFAYWMSVLVNAEYQCANIAIKGIVDEKESKEWYDKHQAIFKNDARVAHVHTLRLDVERSLEEERDLAKLLRAEIVKAKGMKGLVDAFEEAAKKYSKDVFSSKGGDVGWLEPQKEFHPKIAEMITQLPGESLSEVMTVDINGKKFVYLVLISEKWRDADVVPFESVRSKVERNVRIERKLKSLRERVVIRDLSKPSDPTSGRISKIDNLYTVFGKLVSMKGDEKDEKEEEVAEDERRPLTVQEVKEGMKLGHTNDAYYMGMLVERQLVMGEEMQPAIDYYLRSANGGNIPAMLRIAELYRLGRGVDQSDANAMEWREKALATSALNRRKK